MSLAWNSERTEPAARMPFLSFRHGHEMFDFRCPVCQVEGELGIRPEKRSLIQCPDKCGAFFMVRRPRSLFGKPVLEYVFHKTTTEVRCMMKTHVMRIYFEVLGGHTHLSIFTGQNKFAALGKAGDLAMTNEEFTAWRNGTAEMEWIEKGK